jgi:hypothetical protein
MNELLERRVRERAKDRCQHCKIPTYLSEFTCALDHIVAQQHGGETTSEKLSLSCPHDNSHKGPDIAGIDPVTRTFITLFNPRRHKWQRHVRRDGPYLFGRTAIRRTTDVVLAMNDPDVIWVRRSLIEEGLFPPVD